jgi:hypothetical protein
MTYTRARWVSDVRHASAVNTVKPPSYVIVLEALTTEQRTQKKGQAFQAFNTRIDSQNNAGISYLILKFLAGKFVPHNDAYALTMILADLKESVDTCID